MDIESAFAAVHALAPRAAIAREAARIRRDGIDGALAIAGNPLGPDELGALLDRGVTLGVHPLEAYLVARDLAAAAAWVGDHRPRRSDDRGPLLTLDDVRTIHAMATAGSPAARPGAWRLGVVVSSNRVVSPPPWIVPFELAGLVERFRSPPEGTAPVWIAAFLARFARIRPFADANRRTALLAASLVLGRLGAPPLVVPRARAATFRGALAAATAGERGELEGVVAGALQATCNRLIAAGGDDPLLPLRALAGPRYAALIKAAKRGRLRAIERDGRVLSTAAWVAEYRAGRR